MTKSNASKKTTEPLSALLQKPETTAPAPRAAGFPLTSVDACVESLVKSKSNSTARYFTINKSGGIVMQAETVCFHQISGACSQSQVQGLGIAFQGYGGFDELHCGEMGDRFRPAVESDLYANKKYPFVNVDEGHYNAESLEWLKGLLDPEGPFKTLLPLMLDNTPETVQARRAFIFPDVSLIPARLTWCFAIASRIGYANARALWRYLHLLDKGLDKRTAMLIATGFEHEIRNGEVTGRIIKSYTGGFLGVDTTAYAGRFLTSSPVLDPPFAGKKAGTYGSSEVFKSGKIDLKNLLFSNWEAVIEYTQERGRDQSKELGLAA